MADIEKQEAPQQAPEAHGRKFTRLVAKDSRDKQYGMKLRHRSTALTRHWQLDAYLDQGGTSQCVAYSATHFLLASPVRNTTGGIGRGEFMRNLYVECQRNDEWPGEEPDYEGTSVRAAAKILKARGYISEYSWAWDAETVAQWILQRGPVMVGTWWKWDMFDTDRSGFISATGQNVGGHAYLLVGINRSKEVPRSAGGGTGAFRLHNSWGRGWGNRGRAWISFAQMDQLIRDDGEACAAVEVDTDR